MRTGMVAVIAAHGELDWEGSTGRVYCECDAKISVLSASIQTQYRKLREHLADELIAAGYGDVREAAASALRAAAVEAHARGDIGKDSPYAVSVTAFLNWRAEKALEATP